MLLCFPYWLYYSSLLKEQKIIHVLTDLNGQPAQTVQPHVKMTSAVLRNVNRAVYANERDMSYMDRNVFQEMTARIILVRLHLCGPTAQAVQDLVTLTT
ncbi:uncharacterized protein WCC33_012725 isoform 2-T2 [Rhinophrynus dorsalis]